ncbi:MAG: hypothetical protein ABI573_07720 [Chloroflexota bacterium]
MEVPADLDTKAADRPVARPAPDKETSPKEVVRTVVGPDPVSSPPVTADPNPPDPAAATVETASNGPMRPERAAPATSAVNGAPVQQRVGEAEQFGATAPQLRRFIKSRTYVPMHELRRRFSIEGGDDDVTGVDVDREHRVFVGLPTREGRLLGELFRAGDVGYELSLDPISPIVVGVFPMRPVARG